MQLKTGSFALQTIDSFMSNFLFANITSIFHCSSSIIDIINQLPPATAPQNGNVAAQDTHELSENIDQEGNVQPNANRVAELQAKLFGEKIYGEAQEEMDNFIADSISKYSKAKKSQGKSKEEEMIDNVNSRLTSVLLSYADKEATNLEEGLTKQNKKKAEIHIRKAINEEIEPFEQ
ncbi:Uncharacterised protein [Prevotella disiens]|uniref:Uncharacterized protein n=1 Tax=Prevotella disiens TaxID=28130 RepID=A0A379DVR4_9BACT|nr:Uncharacterised protein [Prevotella disiens]